MVRRLETTFAALAVFLLAITACSGDDDSPTLAPSNNPDTYPSFTPTPDANGNTVSPVPIPEA